jgi:hypothetical protein
MNEETAWATDYSLPIPDMLGLIPCELQCEQGWLPLVDGNAVKCESCARYLD